MPDRLTRAQWWAVIAGAAIGTGPAGVDGVDTSRATGRATGAALTRRSITGAKRVHQGCVPGVRGYGGQYTHAALWTVLALATLGDGDRAAAMFSMLNPVNLARTPAQVESYRVEPYVVAADVYSGAHTGRGGWTWYTGSAGWMYRVGIEAILGLTMKSGALRIDPCIPRDWPGYEAVLRTAGGEFHIVVENPRGVNRGVRSVEVDGKAATDGIVPLNEATGRHDIKVILG